MFIISNITKSKYILISGLTLSTLTLVGMFMSNQTNMELHSVDNDLEWSFNSNYNMNKKEFNVLLNDKTLVKTKEYSLENYKKVDNQAPDKVENYVHNYTDEGFELKWDKAMDNGGENNYVVQVINSNGKVLDKSNTLSEIYISGIKGYLVYLNDELYKETTENNIFISNEDLIEGKNVVKLECVDNNGNKSESIYEFLSYKLEVSIKNNQLSALINDKEQSYKYELHIEGLDKPYTFTDSLNIEDLFDDKVSPLKPTISHNLNDTLLSFSLNSEDKGTDYSFRVIGVGETHNNKVYSNELTHNQSSGLKGYHYYLGDDKNHSVTIDDTFTPNNYIEISELEYKTYYLKAVAVDNNGKLSDETTIALTIKSPLPNDAKMSLIQSMSSKNNKVEDKVYYSHLKALYNYIPSNVLTSLKSKGIKIEYKTTGNTEYSISQNKINVNTTNNEAGIIRAVATAFNNLPTNSTYSYYDDFYSLYLKENTDFYNKEFLKTHLEYFVDCFELYIINKSKLKSKVPKTYEYFNKFL